MIAVDASAVLAILFEEPEGPAFLKALAEMPGVISPVNYWEVLVRAHVDAGEPGAARALALMNRLGLEVAQIGSQDAHLAYAAVGRFGKGAGGPLNLGDCFAYALAQLEGGGLLYKGNDFSKTDVKPAL